MPELGEYAVCRYGRQTDTGVQWRPVGGYLPIVLCRRGTLGCTESHGSVKAPGNASPCWVTQDAANQMRALGITQHAPPPPPKPRRRWRLRWPWETWIEKEES